LIFITGAFDGIPTFWYVPFAGVAIDQHDGIWISDRQVQFVALPHA